MPWKIGDQLHTGKMLFINVKIIKIIFKNRESYLLYDEKSTSLIKQQYTNTLIAHEGNQP